ncbi:MAG: Lipid biosynthesis acyltransferase [Chthoniobacteraceae bacterium]|nr:Lipid biosynthesis acyltransferase [Chthoniobacteraceae bacterium]
MTPWKRFRFRLEELGCRCLAWSIPKLPRFVCLRLGNFLAGLAYRLDGRGRAAAFSNLECAFGNRFSNSEREEIVRASYRNFARTMLDLFWARNLTTSNFTRWIELEGFEAFSARLAEEGRGSIMMCVHQGNWEWASLATGFLGLPTTIVAENFKNPRLTSIFSRSREISGHTIIAQENSILRLLKIAKRRGQTGMLIDLSLPPTQAATVIEAFGMKMCVPLLHAVLADRANAMLIPVETHPLPDGRCRVIAHPPVEIEAGQSLQQIAQRCWDAMEPIVRERPDLYLWPYKHFRYKPNGTAQTYPSYANASGKFEKLLKAVSQPAVVRAKA